METSQLGEDSTGGGDDGNDGNDGHLDDLESLCGVNSGRTDCYRSNSVELKTAACLQEPMTGQYRYGPIQD